jgi:endoglucanase
MDRVEEVVNEVLARDMYAVVNVHHDASEWADWTASGANVAMIEEKFGALWFQIATRFACTSSKLIFEPLNEAPGTTEVDAAEFNKLNDIFLTNVNAAGGYNPQRVVSLGLG